MLVLTRREGESIIIGENIEIKVLQVGNTVQIGIIAPRQVPVWRKEIFEEVAQANVQAASVEDTDALAGLLQSLDQREKEQTGGADPGEPGSKDEDESR